MHAHTFSREIDDHEDVALPKEMLVAMINIPVYGTRYLSVE
jgi:hypothetical protein